MFEEYRLNLPSIRLNSKLYQRADERTDLMIKQQAFDKVNEIKTYKHFQSPNHNHILP